MSPAASPGSGNGTATARSAASTARTCSRARLWRLPLTIKAGSGTSDRAARGLRDGSVVEMRRREPRRARSSPRDRSGAATPASPRPPPARRRRSRHPPRRRRPRRRAAVPPCRRARRRATTSRPITRLARRALARQHRRNRRLGTGPFRIGGELGCGEQPPAEPLTPVARHPSGGGNRRQHEDRRRRARRARRRSRRRDGREAPCRSSSARSAHGAPVERASRTRSQATPRRQRPALRIAGSAMPPPAATARRLASTLDPHPGPPTASSAPTSHAPVRSSAMAVKRRHRISTARAGAPSTPSSLSGRQTSRYGPARDLAEVEPLDDEDAARRAGACAPRRSLLPNCSIER